MTNEAFILEIADDFKQQIKAKDNKYYELAEKHNQLFKHLIMVYSICRNLDEALEKIEFPANCGLQFMKHNIEQARAQCSTALDNYLPKESDSDGE